MIPGPRILVVEDDDSFREDLIAALESEGYQVTGCANGARALELATQEPFDLVISDVRMAGIDGLETLERFQSQQPSVATLVITGYTAEADSIRAVRLGVGDYLKKPFRLDEFLSAVERLLRRHRERQRRERREENWRDLSAWALRTPEREQGARLARLLAEEMGLNAEQAAQARVLVLLGKRDPLGLPGEFLSLAEELGADAPSAPARVAQLALGSEPRQDAERGALERARQRLSAGGSADEARRQRALLQLARAQEQSGAGAEAVSSYTRLVAQKTGQRPEVEALLGLMRLCPENSRDYAQQAVQLARQLNPLLWGVSCLEAGLTLAGPESQALLEQAWRLGKELGQPVLEAEAALALGKKDELERALTALLDPDAAYELIEGARWIAPIVLRLQAAARHPLQERLLSRLGRETPTILRDLAQAENLTPPVRLALVTALSGSSHPAALEALRSLAADPEAQVRQAADKILGTQLEDPAPPALRIYTLGGFEVYRGDERIPDGLFRSAKQRFLLARLAAADRPISIERVVDELWGESDQSSGRNSLNSAVSHLRKLLKPAQWPQEIDYLVRDSAGLQLNPNLPHWHDCSELLKLVETTSVDSWKRAVGLYRGPYLDNCYLDWAETLRTRVENAVVRTLQKLIDVFTAQNRWAEVIEYSQRWLQLDNCSQEAHLAVMRAHLQSGRPEAAIRQFETCKRVLKRELDLEPSIPILEAHQRALLMG